MGRVIVNNVDSNRISIIADLASSGWGIDNGKLVHEKSTSGFAINNSLNIMQSTEYKITYTVEDYVEGSVFVIVGSTAGISRNTNGTFTEIITATNNGNLSFYSDGNLKVSNLLVTSGKVEGQTIVFSEKGIRWAGSYAFIPDEFIRYKGVLFTMKDGELYEHNTSNRRNVFYGKKYPSIVRFISNGEYDQNKVFLNLKIDSVGAWQIDSVKTNKTDQFPKGMLSKIPKGNIELIDGKYWADFFKDMNDPMFRDILPKSKRELEALFNGRTLQGNYLEIEMSCDSEKEMKLVSVTVFSAKI